jgi:hypothetical protein
MCVFALGTGLMTLSGGCSGGDSLPKERLSGTVTLDGQPLEQGTIRFMPTAQENASTSTETIITSGAYEIPASTGLLPGPYQVSISAVEEAKGSTPAPKVRRGPGYDPVGGTGVEEATADVRMRELIPAKYNIKSTLKADVTKGGKNVFDFPLMSK